MIESIPRGDIVDKILIEGSAERRVVIVIYEKVFPVVGKGQANTKYSCREGRTTGGTLSFILHVCAR